MALNDKFIKNSTKHSGKPSGDKYTDGRGMYLLVTAAGKYWRFNYRYDGKRKTLEDAVFWVLPNLKLDGFHISKHYKVERKPNIPIEQFAHPDDPYDQREWDGMSMYDGTKFAVRQDTVDESLRYFGIEDPTSVIWNFSGACQGSARPFGEPLGE